MAEKSSNSNNTESLISRSAKEPHEVWNAIDNLKTDMNYIKLDMSAISVKIDNLAGVVGQIVKSTNEASKTPWNLILGIMAIMITMITAIGGAVLAPLYLSDGFLITEISKHIELEGHPKAMVMAAEMKKDVERIDGDTIEISNNVKLLDEALQREMRVLDQVQQTKLDALDATLQREMRMADSLTSARVDATSAELSVITTELQRIKDRLLETESDRYTGSRAHEDRENLHELTRRLSERMAAIEQKEGIFSPDP
jgi:hypothetical protein